MCCTLAFRVGVLCQCFPFLSLNIFAKVRKVGSALDEPYLCKAKTEIWRRIFIDDKSLLVFALHEQICLKENRL